MCTLTSHSRISMLRSMEILFLFSLLVTVTIAINRKRPNQDLNDLQQKKYPKSEGNIKGKLKKPPQYKEHLHIKEDQKVYDFKYNMSQIQNQIGRKDKQGLPESSGVDWVGTLATAFIYDQDCFGCCYAIGTIGSIVGQWARRTGNLIELSVQHYCDCTFMLACSGEGGFSEDVFEYVKRAGLHTEKKYPFECGTHSCRLAGKGVPRVYINTYVKVPENEDALEDAVRNIGPIAVAVYAGEGSDRWWENYKGGLFDASKIDHPFTNHIVLLVGFTADYWKIKNSHGSKWGESGFMYLKRGNNPLGILEDAFYPIIRAEPNNCARMVATVFCIFIGNILCLLFK